ncbi:MAG TPA: protein kinase [Planctomycetota bacterium]|nr:protein kinase [Planctomycetota bacterium]
MVSIPKSLGKYIIVGPIGKGGMGEVWKAFQPDLNRHVAIKTLLAGEQASDDFLQRFQREARLAAKLVHPNIVQIHDFGTEGKLHYLVMEYVEGRSLKEVMAEKRLDPESALKIAHSVARTLKFAHDHQIIHRDIKPENILIDRQGRVRILDFGLAKSLADGKALTVSSVMVGTPYYMSPEQAFAAPEEVDARTDLYSLGAVLYEMLTGRPPFQGGTVLAILRKIEEEEPPPPGISPSIDGLVQKAMDKDPARRFQTAGDLADAIRGCLSGSETALSRVPPPALRAPEPAAAVPARRRSRSWALGAAGGAGLLGLLAWAALHHPEEPAAPPEAAARPAPAPRPADPQAPLRALLERKTPPTAAELSKFAEDPALRRLIGQHYEKRGQFSQALEYLKGYERAMCDLSSARSLQRFASPALFRLSIPRPRDLQGPEAFLIDAIERHQEGKQDAARLKLKNAEYADAPSTQVLLVRSHLDLWDVWLDPGGDSQKLVLATLRRELDRSTDLCLQPIRAIAAQLDGDAAGAREVAERLKRQAPRAAESFLVSAILFQRSGRIDLALEEFKTARDLDPRSPELLVYEVYLRWLEVLGDPEHEKLEADPGGRKMDLREMKEILDDRLRHDHFPAALLLRAAARALESKWEEAQEDLRRLEKRASLERISVDHERLAAFVYGGSSRSRLLDAACDLQLHLGRADQALTTAEQITGEDMVEEERRDLLRGNHRRIARLSAANEEKALRHLEEALKLGAAPKELQDDNDLGDLRQKAGFLELVKKYEN